MNFQNFQSLLHSEKNLIRSDAEKSEPDQDQTSPNILRVDLYKMTDWTYTMRRNMQEVAPNIFLGPYITANCSKLQYLLDHGITHIICIRHILEANFIKPNFPDRFKYLVLNIADTCTENIIQHFQTVKAFIDEGLNSGGRILVHGNAGLSRCVTLVLAYIMETYEVSLPHAFLYVQQRRYCINPSENFIRQLREYEPIWQARKTLRNGQQSSIYERSKRKIDETCQENLELIQKKVHSRF